MHIIFETLRLLLRRFTIEDAPLIYQLNSDPDIVKYAHEPVLENAEQAKKILDEIILPQYILNFGRWAIHKKDDGRFIGWCGIKYMPKTGIYDLGYRLLKTEWGKGYATEAARETVLYGINHLQIPLITAMAHIENTASIRVMEKIGMSFIRYNTVDAVPVKVYIISAADIKNIC
ncbi:MAG TPA: GNAT family N-acetyltransferase [Chitinophagaceae bacterium]|nr:GNAT family N-acetyltransferase [Chitinophagaceae bacterium]